MPDGRLVPSRRTFLVTAGLVAGAVTVPSRAAAHAAPRSRSLPADPFTLGVASGDPDHDGFVLWTRLALQPLAEDGLGGMPSRTLPVRWEVATDERFRHIVRRGSAVARPEAAHSVHVELNGLQPGRDYWYRFRVERYISPVGRTRTAPGNLRPGPDDGVRLVFQLRARLFHGLPPSGRRRP